VQTFPTNPLIGNGRETENTPIREDGLTTANASPIRQADDKTPAKWVRNMAW